MAKNIQQSTSLRMQVESYKSLFNYNFDIANIV